MPAGGGPVEYPAVVPAKPMGITVRLRASPLAVFGMDVADDYPGGDGGDDDQECCEHDALSLSCAGQSSATRGRGLRSRSGFGSFDPSVGSRSPRGGERALRTPKQCIGLAYPC